MPDRRRFLGFLTSGAVLAAMPMPGWPAVAGYQRLLVLVELKGGNDGLNTIVPFADPAYAALRPRLALERHSLLQLDERTGAHPQLAPLQAIWQQRELAIVQSVGYPDANLSHFRSIEIWDTASRSNQYLEEGWLGRTFAGKAPPASYAADGVAVGSADLGPLAGAHARTVAIANARQFQQLARTAQPRDGQGGGALQHLLKVEEDIAVAAQRLSSSYQFKTQFPDGAFGESVKAACQIVAGGTGVAAIRLSLNGFDTHQNQPAKHADLLRQLAEGLLALRSAMQELGRWNETLVMTYGEFGRRAKENQSNGTDHGTAAPQLVLGGRVAGGLFGEAPRLNQLDGNGNLPFAVDFRSLYATVLEDWWGMPSNTVLGGRFERLPLLRG
ncbi:MAG: DUF1501 domain-containing protein [Zoogloeaceae bacterium]|nr:DUF1501 domain-containing protein [Zoogloeaceae bacterium]